MDSDRARGALLGLAVGDALGVPVEFTSRTARDADPVQDMRGGGAHGQAPGTWSDDSSLAFCTAESLVAGWDLDDMGRRFVDWLCHGYWSARGAVFDVGATTYDALIGLERGRPAQDAGRTDEDSNGNGSLMRILPVALRFHDAEPADLVDKAHQASRLTHGHPRSQVACGIYVLLARRLARGTNVADACRLAAEDTTVTYEGSELGRELAHFGRLLGGSLATVERARVSSSGYVVDTLDAAVWCLLTTDSFPECVLAAVNLGSDTDTVGAVAGGLAGLAYGVDAIPTRWLDQLARRADIVDLVDRLVG